MRVFLLSGVNLGEIMAHASRVSGVLQAITFPHLLEGGTPDLSNSFNIV